MQSLLQAGCFPQYKCSPAYTEDMCVTGTGRFCSFETGYHKIFDTIQLEKYRYLFNAQKKVVIFN